MTQENPTDLFPSRLKQARELRGFSQSGLAATATLPPTSISHFEAGTRKPSFDNLRRLADALNVTADFLLGRVSEPEAIGGPDVLARHGQNLSGANLDLAESFLKMLVEREQAKKK